MGPCMPCPLACQKYTLLFIALLAQKTDPHICVAGIVLAFSKGGVP
jgi:hypothetical protein